MFSCLKKMFSCSKKTRKESKDETLFIENGRMLLEELIASCNGKCNPIRNFSSEELRNATNNYHQEQLIERDADYMLYKGYLQDRPISVKRYVPPNGREWIGSPITDIVIGSQMAVHKNVLRLIGCCLETEHPVLVYEFVGKRTLEKYIIPTNGMQSQVLSWKHRVKIAADIANAMVYLHTALSRSIIHRNIRPRTIILGEDYCAKLMDFSLSIAIPEGETHVVVDAVSVRMAHSAPEYFGTMAHSAPEYLLSGYLTEKADVYYFGVLLLQLLSGQQFVCPGGSFSLLSDHVNHHVENSKLIQTIDPTALAERTKQHELQAFATLALSCVSSDAEERPMMIDVAKELKRIEQSGPPSNGAF